jgi:hypothetical protein
MGDGSAKPVGLSLAKQIEVFLLDRFAWGVLQDAELLLALELHFRLHIFPIYPFTPPV